MSSTDAVNTPMAEPAQDDQDLGPLAWVLDELRKSLDGAVKCLRRFVRDAEQARAMYLCELALDLAGRVLRPGGDFLIKIFQGEGFDVYHKQVRTMFDKVQMRKPLSSRDRSREQYLLARGFRGNN